MWIIIHIVADTTDVHNVAPNRLIEAKGPFFHRNIGVANDEVVQAVDIQQLASLNDLPSDVDIFR